MDEEKKYQLAVFLKSFLLCMYVLSNIYFKLVDQNCHKRKIVRGLESITTICPVHTNNFSLVENDLENSKSFEFTKMKLFFIIKSKKVESELYLERLHGKTSICTKRKLLWYQI